MSCGIIVWLIYFLDALQYEEHVVCMSLLAM